VDERCGHEVRRDTAGAAFEILDLLLFDAWQAPYAGTDYAADTFGIALGDFKARAAPSLCTRCHAIMDERIHLLGFFGTHVLCDIEIFDFTRYLGVKRRWVETRYAPYT